MMEHHFQVVVLGTGLTESIAAAALSKAGYTVAHLDPNEYYGAGEASLSPDELIRWAMERSNEPNEQDSTYSKAQRKRYTEILSSSSPPPHARHYALSLSPAVVAAVGPLIDSLVASGVARYGGYKLVDRVAIYDVSGALRSVPGSKEDVFRSKDLSLIDKRRLMRFLMFAAGSFEEAPELSGKEKMPFTEFLANTFSLPSKAVSALAYALAFCYTNTEPTLNALQRIRGILRSSGRYGPSPFLVGHYGGLGEIAQGFCRTSAVQGGVYVLGRHITSIKPHSCSTEDTAAPLGSFGVRVEGFPELMTSDVVLASPDLVTNDLKYLARCLPLEETQTVQQPVAVARCIATLDFPVHFGLSSPHPDEGSNTGESTSAVDTGIIIFPPGAVTGGSSEFSVTALITGEGSMSAPRGKWVVYISLPLPSHPTASAKAVLEPYLDALLALTQSSASEQQHTEATESDPGSESYNPFAPTFVIFYHEHLDTPLQQEVAADMADPLVLVSPPRIIRLPEASDAAATQAEALFKTIVRNLQARGIRPQNAGPETTDHGVPLFWPPLEKDDDDDEAW